MAQIPNQNSLSKFNPSKSRLILALIHCNGGVGHVLLNQSDVKFEAKKISFNVIIFEPTPMNPIYKVYGLIHSNNAMIGICGAALTHTIFLWPGRCSCKWCRLGLNGRWRFAMQDWLGMWGQSKWSIYRIQAE